MQEEKEQDKVGEAGNPVSLSQGFGGVMGSKTEKVCWRKFMMLHKTQKPTLTLLKRKMGWERLSYKDCLIGNLRGGPSWSRKGQEREMGSHLHFVLSPAFSRLTSLLEYAAVKESIPGKAP